MSVTGMKVVFFVLPCHFTKGYLIILKMIGNLKECFATWAMGFDYLNDLVVLKRTKKFLRECLSTLTTDTTSKLDVFGHDGDTLGVDSAQVGVFEETNEVSLGSFLESHHGRGLEAKVSLEILSDFTNQTLEGKLADEELSALLVTTDLTESDGTRPVSVGLLDTTGGRGGLACSLGGELLARSLSSGGFTGSLLGTSHHET